MTDSGKRNVRAVVDDRWRRTHLRQVVPPWLLELGSWIFGALIAFNLVILGAVLTVGPVDAAVKIATAAFALAFPPNVAGFVLLRLVADMRKIGIRPRRRFRRPASRLKTCPTGSRPSEG